MSTLKEKIFSISGITILLSVCGLGVASMAMSKVKPARNFDSNIYFDRLYRSTIQLLVISIMGVLTGVLFLFGKFECSVEYGGWVRSPSIVMFFICFYILAQTADMVNSFMKLKGDDEPDGIVTIPIAFLVGLVSVAMLLCLVYFMWNPTLPSLPSPPSSPSSLTKKLDFFSNEIMF